VGVSDPREFIAAESQRIPFKAALTQPSLWQDAFKNWPLPPIVGWRNWYKRILADNSAKTQTWDTLQIAQCLELSLAETPKNEDLLIAACHFWSNGVNAFLFGHGPMSPTLYQAFSPPIFVNLNLFIPIANLAPKTNGGEQQQALRRRRSRREPCQFTSEAMIAIFSFTIRL
jgi:hypothetical protein